MALSLSKRCNNAALMKRIRSTALDAESTLNLGIQSLNLTAWTLIGIETELFCVSIMFVSAWQGIDSILDTSTLHVLPLFLPTRCLFFPFIPRSLRGK